MVISTVNKDFIMLTLSDINAATNSRDGDIYSDLYKDVYGFRPRYTEFVSTEEFDADFEALINMLNRKQSDEAAAQTRNFIKFVERVNETMELVQGTDRVRAIEIIAEAEDQLEDMEFYGYERLEWTFNLKFGSIKQWLETV
jgi:transcriptional regulator of heat shock response